MYVKMYVLLRKNNMINKIFEIVFSLLCSFYFMKYMRLPQSGIVWIIVFAILFYVNLKRDGKEKSILYYIFSLLLSIAVVLGYHMEFHGDMYTGLKTENYMTSFNFNDFIAVVLLSITWTYLLERFISFLKKKVDKIELKNVCGIGSKKIWGIVSVMLFIAWIPYFLVYYPGYIFGDSLASIAQALGVAKLYNHHPIFYTLFIKLCLSIGIRIYNITFGCAIYTLVQMIYIALALGYQICWIKHKGVSSFICVLIVAFFGGVPFFAQNSIAMWKDPVFSATLTVWIMLYIDFILSKGKITISDKTFWIKNNIIILILCFSRNNGLYIGVLCEFIMLIMYFCTKKNNIILNFKKFLLQMGLLLIIVGIITGPMYTRLGLNGEPVESLGIFLNQMARVAAYDGDMSLDDRNYMENLLPLDKYKDTYRPCVVDKLKWDEKFSQAYLNKNVKGFVKTYFSMFIKNPGTYAEAWALNTYGYWAVNRWELNLDGNNIYKGNLGDIENGENFGITPHSLIKCEKVDSKIIVKTDDPIVFLPILTWFVFLLVLLVIKEKKWLWGIALTPILGLIITLFIATPYAYWQRYGLAQYYSLPIYGLVLIYLLKKKKQDSEVVNETSHPA